MVFYFTSAIVDPPAYVYVGKDKFESKNHSHGIREPVLTQRSVQMRS